MINLKQFLLNNDIKSGTYSLVTYEGKTEPTWFSNMGRSFNTVDDNNWFLESPCSLYKVSDVGDDIDAFLRKYMDEAVSLRKGEDEEDYINRYVLPMIVGNAMYEIENFQCSPYLPKFIDDIKLITERECLEWMLKR